MSGDPEPPFIPPRQVQTLRHWPDLSHLDMPRLAVAASILTRGLSRSVEEFVDRCQGFAAVGYAGMTTACEIGHSSGFEAALSLFYIDPEAEEDIETDISPADYARFLLDLVGRVPEDEWPEPALMIRLRLTALGADDS